MDVMLLDLGLVLFHDNTVSQKQLQEQIENQNGNLVDNNILFQIESILLYEIQRDSHDVIPTLLLHNVILYGLCTVE